MPVGVTDEEGSLLRRVRDTDAAAAAWLDQAKQVGSCGCAAQSPRHLLRWGCSVSHFRPTTHSNCSSSMLSFSMQSGRVPEYVIRERSSPCLPPRLCRVLMLLRRAPSQVANDGGAAPVSEVEALIAAGRELPVMLEKECQVRSRPVMPPALHGKHCPAVVPRRGCRLAAIAALHSSALPAIIAV